MRTNRYYRVTDAVSVEQDEHRARIAQDTAAFLAAGGKIEDVPKGKSKYSVEPPRSWVEESRKKKFGEEL
jgi:hypothetical protein